MSEATTEPAITQATVQKGKRAGRFAVFLMILVVLADIIQLTEGHDILPAAGLSLAIDILALGFLWLVMRAVARGTEAAHMLLVLVWLGLAAALVFFLSAVHFQTIQIFEADAPGLANVATPVEITAPTIGFFNLGFRALALLALAIGGVYNAFDSRRGAADSADALPAAVNDAKPQNAPIPDRTE